MFPIGLFDHVSRWMGVDRPPCPSRARPSAEDYDAADSMMLALLMRPAPVIDVGALFAMLTQLIQQLQQPITVNVNVAAPPPPPPPEPNTYFAGDGPSDGPGAF